MLQAIRDGSKGIVAKIIVGLIILTFALFGIESIVALGGGEDAPATVNGEDISELQVQQSVEMQKRRLQSQLGESFDPSMFKDSLLRQSAIESLVNEALMKQAAAEAGVFYSDAEVDKLILQSPEFQVAGQFDRDRYDLVLRSAGFTRSSYRELLRTSLTLQQVQNAWQSTSFATSFEAQTAAKLEAQTRNFSYIKFPLEAEKKSVSVSDEEIQQYFDANPAEFMTEDKVSIQYVELDRANLAKNISITEDEIADRYAEMQAEANSKKEYRAAHILLLSNDDEARQTLMEVQAKLQDGEAFDVLAKTYSEDDTSKFSGGDLGFASSEIYEDAFAQALEGLEVDQVSDVIETRDGLHLVKLLEVRQPEVAALSELKDTIEKTLREEAVQVVYIESLETLKDEAFSSTNLNVPANALNLTIKKAGPFSESGGQGIAANRDVVMSAFSEVVLNEGANSEVIELSESRAVVIHLDEFIESKVKALSDVKSQIEKMLVVRKATEQLVEKATAALEQAKKGEFDGKWKSEKEKTRSFTGVDSQLVSEAFSMAMNADKPGYSLINTQNGDQVLVRLDAVNRDVNVSETEDELQKVTRSKSYNEYKAYFQYQLDNADIDKS